MPFCPQVHVLLRHLPTLQTLTQTRIVFRKISHSIIRGWSSLRPLNIQPGTVTLQQDTQNCLEWMTTPPQSQFLLKPVHREVFEVLCSSRHPPGWWWIQHRLPSTQEYTRTNSQGSTAWIYNTKKTSFPKAIPQLPYSTGKILCMPKNNGSSLLVFLSFFLSYVPGPPTV